MEQDNTDLKKSLELARKKFYVLAFEIFLIFGLPAGAAFFLGKYLIENYGFGKLAQVLALAGAFVLSWVIFIFKFREISKEIADLKNKIDNKK